MPTAHIDHIETLECVEEKGVVVSLTRVARVNGLVTTNYQVLMEAINQVVPVYGSKLEGDRFTSLTLQNRRVKLTANDPGCCDVILEYGKILDGQDLGNGGIIYGKMRSVVTQKTTNFFRFKGTGAVQPIVLGHTYPLDDPDYPGQYIEQTGEISVYHPESNFSMNGYLFLADVDPQTFANYLEGSVNANPWKSKGAREWMCTEVQYEFVGRAPNPGRNNTLMDKYHYGFEFQHNPDGWNPTAVFTDPRTQKPPANVLFEGQQPSNKEPGVKNIRYQRELNYNFVFGAYFEGKQLFA